MFGYFWGWFGYLCVLVPSGFRLCLEIGLVTFVVDGYFYVLVPSGFRPFLEVGLVRFGVSLITFASWVETLSGGWFGYFWVGLVTYVF